MKKILRNQRGFTLLQVLIAVVVLGIAATVTLKVTSQGTAEANIVESVEEILDLQRAMYGDLRVADQTNFGFVGDLGRLPTSLEELITNVNNDPNWDGPYITADIAGTELDLFLDAWGNLFDYDNSTGQIGINSASVGDIPVLIPEVFENLEDILFGDIKGHIRDIYDNPPRIGDRKHILVWMEPIFTETSWPPPSFRISKKMSEYFIWKESGINIIRLGMRNTGFRTMPTKTGDIGRIPGNGRTRTMMI